MEKTYAKAITNLIARGASEETVVKNLVAHLKSVGRMKLLSRILGELKAAGVRNLSSEAHVEVAHEKDSAASLKAAAAAGVTAKHTTVNSSLLSGFRARGAGMLVDHSGKRALVDLYRKIVS